MPRKRFQEQAFAFAYLPLNAKPIEEMAMVGGLPSRRRHGAPDFESLKVGGSPFKARSVVRLSF